MRVLNGWRAETLCLGASALMLTSFMLTSQMHDTRIGS